MVLAFWWETFLPYFEGEKGAFDLIPPHYSEHDC